MTWAQFRSVFELMQRNAVDRKRGGSWKGRPQECGAE